MAGGRKKGTSKTGGRKKGALNKTTAEIKKLAQEHGVSSLEGIAKLAKSAENEGTRLAAYKELLDRGFGKARQPVGGDEGGPPISVIHRIIVRPGDTDGD